MPPRESLRDRAYQHILRKLTTGELPAGSVVSEPSLAAELDISRTPVREAIHRLAHEGLLEQVPRYGTVVRAPERRELAELFEVREAMEAHAAARAAKAMTAGDLRSLHRLCQEMAAVAPELSDSKSAALTGDALRRFLAVDMAFHMVLLGATGNERMMRAVANWRVFMRIFSYPRQTHDRAVVEGALRFHRRILQAVERHDPAAARRLMSEHIHVSRDQALASFERRAGPHGRTMGLALPEDLRAELDRIQPGLGTDIVEERRPPEQK
jgi:DNA-binding GntR family transcriptional regulator